MKAVYRSLRRAPGRVLVSVLAVGLAVGAIGVFAVPSVAAGTLRATAAEDKLAHLIVDTTPLASTEHVGLEAIGGFEAAAVRTTGVVDTAERGRLRLVGFDPEDQQVNIVSATEGRFPESGETLVSQGVADIGDAVVVDGTSLTVVGVGGTTWWSDTDAFFVTEADAASLVDRSSTQLMLRVDDPTLDHLNEVIPELRDVLAGSGATFVSFPELLPDGKHPIEEDLEQISTMIGLLGVVAGVVALILLASTASTLITERTREVAVMRALGSQRRPLRRRLRRLALATSVGGLVIGIPLGIAVSNYVARMILERFVGVTPDLGISWPVVAASVVFAVVGARLVAARAARRVTKLPLAEALHDRSGSTWGRRFSDRVVSRIRFGGLVQRLALRNNLRARARSLSAVAQIAAGTGAIIVVASLATSVNAFNAGETEPWNWDQTITAVDPGLPFLQQEFDQPGAEPAIWAEGSYNDWEVDVRGLVTGTEMIDTTVEEGRWIDRARSAVVSKGFADHQGIQVGDTIEVELASGSVSYEVAGLHRSRARDLYVSIDELAADLASPNRANMAYVKGAQVPTLEAPADVVSLAQMNAEDMAARDAIIAVFTAIGVIVAGVAALGVASLMAVSMYERRHEFATILAVGGQKRHIRRALVLELLPLAVLGSLFGVAAGWFGAAGIMGAFEEANAVDLGMEFAWGAVAPVAAGAIAMVILIAAASARRSSNVPAAATLRAAA